MCPEKLSWISHVWPPKPSATAVTEHTRSHNNETLGGFLSRFPNYKAYILQPFEILLFFSFFRIIISLSMKAFHVGSLHSQGR